MRGVYKYLTPYSRARCSMLPDCGCIVDTTCGWCDMGPGSSRDSGAMLGTRDGPEGEDTCSGRWSRATCSERDRGDEFRELSLEAPQLSEKCSSAGSVKHTHCVSSHT